jgi:hypothetical protein
VLARNALHGAAQRSSAKHKMIMRWRPSDQATPCRLPVRLSAQADHHPDRRVGIGKVVSAPDKCVSNQCVFDLAGSVLGATLLESERIKEEDAAAVGRRVRPGECQGRFNTFIECAAAIVPQSRRPWLMRFHAATCRGLPRRSADSCGRFPMSCRVLCASIGAVLRRPRTLEMDPELAGGMSRAHGMRSKQG